MYYFGGYDDPFPEKIDNEHTERYNFSLEKPSLAHFDFSSISGRIFPI